MMILVRVSELKVRLLCKPSFFHMSLAFVALELIVCLGAIASSCQVKLAVMPLIADVHHVKLAGDKQEMPEKLFSNLFLNSKQIM